MPAMSLAHGQLVVWRIYNSFCPLIQHSKLHENELPLFPLDLDLQKEEETKTR